MNTYKTLFANTMKCLESFLVSDLSNMNFIFCMSIRKVYLIAKQNCRCTARKKRYKKYFLLDILSLTLNVQNLHIFSSIFKFAVCNFKMSIHQKIVKC